MEYSGSVYTEVFLFFSLCLLGIYCYRLKQKQYILEDKYQEALRTQNINVNEESELTELGAVCAGTSHEINNALSIILPRLTLLMRIHRDPDKQKELAQGLNQITFNCGRIAKAIKDMRRFIYLDPKENHSEFMLNELLDEIQNLCGQRLRNHGIELRLTNTEDISIKGNKTQLEQVMIKLLNNSLQAVDSLEDKWIEISVVENPSSTSIFFKDSGQLTEQDKKQRHRAGFEGIRAILNRHGGTFDFLTNFMNRTVLLELPKTKNYK